VAAQPGNYTDATGHVVIVGPNNTFIGVDRALFSGLLPRFSDRVIEQYRNPKIQALLKEIEAQDDIPAEIKTIIQSFRSGQRFEWKLTSEFDRECMRWSQMRSIAACVSLATRILWVYAVSWVTW